MAYDENEGAEEIVEEGGGYGGGEFIPEAAAKPKPDIFTFILALTFIAFLVGTILAGKELYQGYDVQFWIFSKK